MNTQQFAPIFNNLNIYSAKTMFSGSSFFFFGIFIVFEPSVVAAWPSLLRFSPEFGTTASIQLFPRLISFPSAALTRQDDTLTLLSVQKRQRGRGPPSPRCVVRVLRSEFGDFWAWTRPYMRVCPRICSRASGHPETLYFGRLLDQGVTVTASSGCPAQTGRD